MRVRVNRQVKVRVRVNIDNEYIAEWARLLIQSPPSQVKLQIPPPGADSILN